MTVWKDILGFEGLYQVSDEGSVKALARSVNNKNGRLQQYPERVLKADKSIMSNSTYHRVTLSKNHVTSRFLVHRLVAEAFIPNPYNKPEVNHIDGNKTNNCVNNLEWCTSKENIAHAVDSGLMVGKRGVDNCNAKLTLEQVEEIKRLYKPYSREFGTRSLAKKYGVHHMQISRIVNNKSYQE